VRYSPRFLVAVCLFASSVARAQPSDLSGVSALFERHQYPAARKIVEPYVAAHPDDAEAAFFMGRLEMIAGNPDEAIRYLEIAVRGAPKEAQFHLALGKAYGARAARLSLLKQLSMAKKSRNELEQAVALDPSSLDARETLMRYYLVAPGIAGGSKSKAAEQARAIQALDAYHGRVAAAMIDEGNSPAAAEETYLGAIESAPDKALAYYQLNDLYQHEKRYEEAAQLMQRLYAKNASEVKALYYIGRAGALSGDSLTRAEGALRKYIAADFVEENPMPARAYYYLGMVLEKKGDKAAALAAYQESLNREARKETADALRKARGK
jgi:tetratricopeptide (TPR) repeat protein